MTPLFVIACIETCSPLPPHLSAESAWHRLTLTPTNYACINSYAETVKIAYGDDNQDYTGEYSPFCIDFGRFGARIEGP